MKFIKKHKYKLLTLMLSIVSIFTLFLSINKTYAWEIDSNGNLISSNMANGTIVENRAYGNNGNIYTDNTSKIMSLIEVEPNTKYISNIIGKWVNFYNENRGFISQDGSNPFTTPNNCKYIGLTIPIEQTEIMLNIGEDLLPYEPSGTWYSSDNYNTLKNNYDTLEVQYGDLQDDYEELETNYNTLQDDYDTLEDNYTDLQSDYNDLQDDYDNLNTQYLNLQQEIVDLNRQLNALRQSYNNLQEEYNQLKNNIDNVYNSGSFYYIDYLNSYLSDDPNYTYRYGKYKKYTLNDLVKDQYIVAGKLNITKLDNNILVTGETGDYFNSNYPYYLGLDFNFINNIPVKNVDFQFQDFLSNSIESNNFIVTNGYSDYTISLSNNIDHITYEILSNNSNIDLTDYYLKTWNITTRATYSGDYPYIVSNYSIDSLTYNEGYYDGYNTGINTINNTNNERITYLENEISNLENQINDLDAQILSKNQVIIGLREQIDAQSYDYNLNDMIWTIASTPFESFKQIWNVNFFGVNIAELITGFLTGLIVIWIIKKFF